MGLHKLIRGSFDVKKSEKEKNYIKEHSFYLNAAHFFCHNTADAMNCRKTSAVTFLIADL